MKVGSIFGRLEDAYMRRLEEAVQEFLDLDR